MKIIVNNDKEKELLKRFLSFMDEVGFEFLETEDVELAKENGDDQSLWSNEWRLMRDTFCTYSGIEIDPKEFEMRFEDDSVVTGTCVRCGTHTEGTQDGGPVLYSDYLFYMSDAEQKDWLCEDCEPYRGEPIEEEKA